MSKHVMSKSPKRQSPSVIFLLALTIVGLVLLNLSPAQKEIGTESIIFPMEASSPAVTQPTDEPTPQKIPRDSFAFLEEKNNEKIPRDSFAFLKGVTSSEESSAERKVDSPSSSQSPAPDAITPSPSTSSSPSTIPSESSSASQKTDSAPSKKAAPSSRASVTIPSVKGKTHVIYVSTSGNDANDGLTPQTAVKTLAGAEKRYVNGPRQNAEVFILPGTYSDSHTWTTAMEGYRLTLQAEGAKYDGGGKSGYWLDFSPRGGKASFIMEGGHISGYANGLRVSGGYDYKRYGKQAQGVYSPVTFALVDGVRFSKIGSKFSNGPGYAALHIQNTKNAHIKNTSFKNIENSGSKGSYVHAIYSVMSQVTASDSTFDKVSGDPVRARHSSQVSLHGNSFTQAGVYGLLTDWFCDVSCAKKSSQSFECPSSLTYSSSNIRGTSYGGSSVRETARTINTSGAHSSC